MTRKIFVYMKSGGLSEVIIYSFTFLKKIFFYRSETNFLYLDRNKFNQLQKNICEVDFKIILNKSDLEKVNFARIQTLNYERWFEKNSVPIIGFNKCNPISFTWTHFHAYIIHNLCQIELSDDKCWVGPTFVDNSMRGRGINKTQISFQISNAPKNIQYFITSANASNIASIKSFEKLGFKLGLKIIKNYGIFSNQKTTMNYYNEGIEIIKIV